MVSSLRLFHRSLLLFTDRGLKCGGSLSERAARLWMVKGKTPREYPKSILTPEMKKKVAEEEEAERKAAKKAGKKLKKTK